LGKTGRDAQNRSQGNQNQEKRAASMLLHAAFIVANVQLELMARSDSVP
jgi:hypothetical protein